MVNRDPNGQCFYETAFSTIVKRVWSHAVKNGYCSPPPHPPLLYIARMIDYDEVVVVAFIIIFSHCWKDVDDAFGSNLCRYIYWVYHKNRNEMLCHISPLVKASVMSPTMRRTSFHNIWPSPSESLLNEVVEEEEEEEEEEDMCCSTKNLLMIGLKI